TVPSSSVASSASKRRTYSRVRPASPAAENARRPPSRDSARLLPTSAATTPGAPSAASSRSSGVGGRTDSRGGPNSEYVKASASAIALAIHPARHRRKSRAGDQPRGGAARAPAPLGGSSSAPSLGTNRGT